MKVKIADIKVVDELYPRFALDNDAVERYRMGIENLPPIVLSKSNILIDGKHRLRAYQLSAVEEIEAEILGIVDKAEILKEAIRRNSTHGKQLDREEKKALARRLFESCEISEIQALLGVGKSSVYTWTEDLLAERNAEQEAEMLRLYLKMWTQERIAEELGCTQKTVSNALVKIPELEKLLTPPESLKVYDVWNFAKLDKTYGQNYPGRIPGQIIENMLWYWTKPLDVVCDPMVGGGTTIDVCKAMCRRYIGFDTNLVHDDVIKHDIGDGWPKLPETYEKADLVFMDPPYFKKKAEEYNLPEEYNTKEGFLTFAKKWVEFSNQALKPKGIVALLISDYVDYENPNESIFSDEYADLFSGYQRLYKISVPLSTEQYNGFHVDRAKKEKQLLIRGRELYILQKKGNGQ